jgi:enoyl-CoA hydratase/carnithine racemase
MAEAASEAVVLTRRTGDALWITINREERRNALNPDVIAAIERAVLAARDDKAVRVLVLTGAGARAFCAGADLSRGTGVFSDGFAEPTTDDRARERRLRGRRNGADVPVRPGGRCRPCPLRAA